MHVAPRARWQRTHRWVTGRRQPDPQRPQQHSRVTQHPTELSRRTRPPPAPPAGAAAVPPWHRPHPSLPPSPQRGAARHLRALPPSLPPALSGGSGTPTWRHGPAPQQVLRTAGSSLHLSFPSSVLPSAPYLAGQLMLFSRRRYLSTCARLRTPGRHRRGAGLSPAAQGRGGAAGGGCGGTASFSTFFSSSSSSSPPPPVPGAPPRSP